MMKWEVGNISREYRTGHLLMELALELVFTGSMFQRLLHDHFVGILFPDSGKQTVLLHDSDDLFVIHDDTLPFQLHPNHSPSILSLSLLKDTLNEKKRLALEHYEAIRESDAVYFIVPEGYMGTSCKLELGYAVASNKPVYFSEPTNDLALDCYVSKFIPLESLRDFLGT